MATGIEAVTKALEAMKDGSGDFAAVRAAVEAAEFDSRPIWMSGDVPEYIPVEGSFEDTVTPWVMRRVISRDEWKELRALWKSKPPATGAATE
jgi:hypothetical protein